MGDGGGGMNGLANTGPGVSSMTSSPSSEISSLPARLDGASSSTRRSAMSSTDASAVPSAFLVGPGPVDMGKILSATPARVRLGKGEFLVGELQSQSQTITSLRLTVGGLVLRFAPQRPCQAKTLAQLAASHPPGENPARHRWRPRVQPPG